MPHHLPLIFGCLGASYLAFSLMLLNRRPGVADGMLMLGIMHGLAGLVSHIVFKHALSIAMELIFAAMAVPAVIWFGFVFMSMWREMRRPAPGEML